MDMHAGVVPILNRVVAEEEKDNREHAGRRDSEDVDVVEDLDEQERGAELREQEKGNEGKNEEDHRDVLELVVSDVERGKIMDVVVDDADSTESKETRDAVLREDGADNES